MAALPLQKLAVVRPWAAEARLVHDASLPYSSLQDRERRAVMAHR
jgi:hypothetical protein